MTMGILSIPAPVRQRRARPWGRQPRRPWMRPDDVGGVGMLLAAIPSLPRAELSRLTGRLIDRMDELDGNPDVELNGDEQEHDGDCRDLSWSEWHTRRQRLSPAGYEAWPGEIAAATEDDEDGHDREQEERHA